MSTVSQVSAEQIELDRDGPVAKILVNRPEARNALNSAMRRRLLEIFVSLRDDPNVRVVTIRGAGGKSFVSGADIGEFAELPTAEDFIRLARLDEELYDAIERLPAPVIAVIDGYALGGGLALAAVCDLRVCSTTAKFGIPSAKSLGNCLSPGMYARLAALIGPARVKELLIAAPILTAEQALAWGIVNEVVEPDALDQHIATLSERLSTHAPLTMWAAKEAVRRLLEPFPTDEDIMQRVLASEDCREGIVAFLDKRPPVWRNR